MQRSCLTNALSGCSVLHEVLVLQMSILRADGDKSDPFYRVAYDFSLVDDTYMMPSKDGKGKFLLVDLSWSLFRICFIKELTAELSPYDDDGKLRKGAKAYSEDYDVVYENHPLKIMVRTCLVLY